MSKKQHTWRNTETRGFSTIELLIAFAVGITLLSAAIMVAFTDPTLSERISINSGPTTALDVALDGTGLSKSTGRIGELVAAILTDWGATADAEEEDLGGLMNYSYTPEITDISPCVKEILNSTDWNSLRDRDRNISFGTAVSNIDVAMAFGIGGCDPTPPGEWDTPESYGSSNVSGIDGGTDVAVQSIGGTLYAFVTAVPPGNPNKEDFAVVNVSDGTNPSVVGSPVDTGVGLNGIVVIGTNAFVIQNDTVDQILVIDVSNPSAPNIINSTSIPNTTTGTTTSVAYYNEKLYIGTAYQPCPPTCSPEQNNEFHIFNASDLSHEGSLNINHNINDIYVEDGYAYLATSDNSGELMIVDISDPDMLEHPDDTGMRFNASGNEDGMSVYTIGDYAFLGRESVGTTANREDYLILDVSDPTSIVRLGGVQLGLGNNNPPSTPRYVSGIVTQGNLSFVTTMDSNEPLFIFDISDITNPVPKSSCGLNFSEVTTALDYHSNLLFTVNRSQRVLRVIYDDPDICS